MKKTIPLLFIAIIALAFAGCSGDMHNTSLSYVSFDVDNFPLDGDYIIGGGFFNNNWSNSNEDCRITIAGGSGTLSFENPVLNGGLYFSLMDPGQWTRSWSAYKKATPEDETWMVNVPIDGGHYVISIDGSTDPMIATVN